MPGEDNSGGMGWQHKRDMVRHGRSVEVGEEILGNGAGRTWAAPPANLSRRLWWGNRWRISNRVDAFIRIILSIRITPGEPHFLRPNISSLRKEPADLGRYFLYSITSWVCIELKLHGWPNLWQKSSSIFPIAGYCAWRATFFQGNGTWRLSFNLKTELSKIRALV